MDDDDGSPADLPLAEAGRRLREGSLTAQGLLDAHLDRIAARDPLIGAFVHLLPDRARAAARRADAERSAGTDRGPLHGIPFAIKDLIDLEGAVVAFGARRHQGRVAPATAPAVQALLDAGAVPVGMVATYEMALVGPARDGAYPPARNPWAPDPVAGAITGGSSSGSAAAVAAGLVRVALGTDTGGSVRAPAAYCGVVGFKPTRGTVPLDGVHPLAASLDHVGPIARSVGDAALVHAALAGAPIPPLGRGLDGVRVGYARDWARAPDAAPGLLDVLDAAVAALSLEGAAVDLVGLPDIALAEAAGAVILHAEALAVHARDLTGTGDAFGRMAYQSLIAGAALDDADVALARRHAGRVCEGIDAALAGRDAVVTATTLTPAPPLAAFAGGRAAWTPMRTLPFNMTGHPALSVPMGFVDGLPVGLQIVGRRGGDATVLRIGAAFEAATDHDVPRPPGLP